MSLSAPSGQRLGFATEPARKCFPLQESVGSEGPTEPLPGVAAKSGPARTRDRRRAPPTDPIRPTAFIPTPPASGVRLYPTQEWVILTSQELPGQPGPG